ncbi:cysteine hydrolase family protein [Prosthecomicrobium pneumaticum]|uniref:Nicotinamidase-related amidase n=1 Tax=Prosthecomicrobium pneumaticum TaxID=81895 RepID=A0A7W9CSX7_9HYPH|nr:cysteine hydrolase family protein [Prosthecomicrobium pneumaticum]MBB5751059.1 nicotinamidase-related amidase [Prosthecomicrobium pneumaticum]
MLRQVNGLYPWPYDGRWSAADTALLVVDMQRDLLDPEGWFALTGGDTAPLVAIVPAVARALALARAARLAVIFTIESHRPDLSDLPANKLWRSRRLGAAIGEAGPLGRHLVRGAAGTAVVAALAPEPGEPVVDKPGKSAFIGCDLDQILRRRGVRNLVFSGVTTDGAVQCTLRDANDRGYECLLLEDATASDVARDHADQVHTLSLAGGHYGSIATVAALAEALQPETVR